MDEKEKNLTDTNSGLNVAPKGVIVPISYTKTNKLITALFMVTDIMDSEEPLRSKLRVLGLGILSDMHTSIVQAEVKIHELLSLLDITSTINLISEMNYNILKKEFLTLDHSIKESLPTKQAISIGDFLSQPVAREQKPRFSSFEIYTPEPIKRESSDKPKARIGVQKGGTLMKALSDKTHLLHVRGENFDALKKQRKDDIIEIIKGYSEGAAIKDIKDFIKDKHMQSLISYGEKTLQRELVSMVKEGILYRTGEKRWSRYFVRKT